MPSILPLTNDGSRTIEVILGEYTYKIQTYYLPLQAKKWIMNIYDEQDNPLIMGVAINPGANNLIKGKVARFKGQALVAVNTGGNPDSPDALGENLFVLYYAEGETPPVRYKDRRLDG